MFRILVKKEDSFATKALQSIGKDKYPIKILQNGEVATPTDVAVFTLSKEQQSLLRFPSRHSRMAAHKLIEAGVVPGWASTTPYLVALREHPNEKTQRTLKDTARFIAETYTEWFSGRSCNCPWGCEPTGESLEAFRKWQKKAFSVETINSRVQSFFANLEPLNVEALQKGSSRIENGLDRLVSAFCLHSDETRKKIVPLDERAQEAVKRFIQALPVSKIDIFTFHPDDVSVLKSRDLEDVILPSVLDDEEEMLKHWEISREFAASSGKVDLKPISDLFKDEDLWCQAWNAAKARAGRMAKSILKNPPPIFRLLSSAQQKRRLAREAVLYLLMTAQYPQSVYLGFEVHAEYWRTGELYSWGDNYLPVMMAPPCLRQHWSSWAVDRRRTQEIQKLAL